MRPLLLIFSLAALAGCGTKTPLSLPPEPAKLPLLGVSVPAPVVAPVASPFLVRDDNNKTVAAAPQPQVGQ